MSPHKSQLIASDDYKVTFILPEQVFEVSSISSHTGTHPCHMVDCLADDTLVQTRPDHASMPSNTEVCIVIENLHKFKGFGA